MPAPRVRGDYDSLGKIASAFGQEAAQTGQTNRSLSQNLNTLKSGDWIGKGAKAFFQEMDSEVMPAMLRLAKALEAADRVTRQISKIIKQAEDDSARLFRLDGGGVLGGLAGRRSRGDRGGAGRRRLAVGQPPPGARSGRAVQRRLHARPDRTADPGRRQ
jgi:WXG100 family type VII secretion target